MTVALTGGFANPAHDSANAFRPILRAMARPGTVEPVSGAQAPGLSIAAATVIATLCDPETPLFLGASVDMPALRDWITFQTGAPIVAAPDAMFALGRWQDMPLDEFAIGTAQYPDRSATLIVECDALDVTGGATLRGPGIRDTARMTLPDADALRANAALFPLGLDFLWTCEGAVAALPRSTKVS